MNATNVKNSLTTAINSLVTSGDITATPLSVAQLVTELSGRVAAYEADAVQRASDLSAANKIANPNKKF